MSAIFGVHNINGKPVSPLLIEEMSKILSHRGPDNQDVWVDGATGFGNRMLWTKSENLHEQLPKNVHNGDLVITADARIDNRDELIKQFDASQFQCGKTLTNSEIILLSYQKWGETCASKLVGDFAFAIWDKKEHRIFCARDHFGVKPFYYFSSEKVFAFATEIKALLLIPEVSKRVNEVRLLSHLESRYENRENTFYQDILRLQPGHAIEISPRGKKTFPYWKLELPKELKLRSDNEYSEALREHFAKAVRRRLDPSVPVGTMLSGGLDSSSITCMVRKLLDEDGKEKQKLHTFSAIFDDVKESDEREYMHAVIRNNNIEPHFVVADKYGPFFEAKEILKFMDEPVYSGNSYIDWLIYKKAKAQGIKVILDGFDGDNTISHGIGIFSELAHERRWTKLARELFAYSKGRDISWKHAFWSWFWLSRLSPLISSNRITNHAQHGIRHIQRRITGSKKFLKVPQNTLGPITIGLNPSFKKRLNGIVSEKSEKQQKPRMERDFHLRNLLDNGHPSVLEVLDRTASAFSMEIRFPFCDKQLIEFCLSVPGEQKMRNGWSRLIMRQAMANILPSEVQWRPGKSNLAPSFNHGFRKFERKLMEEFIVSKPEAIADYVDIESLRKAHQRFLISEASEDDIIAIQRSISLALWLQKTG